ncbi:hypothetical protein RAE21_12045 [Rhodoferax sp. TBRC 17198]|uniref:hypothetical protein n=1 Tax=Rhodoferax potami TaxID=3068338 RepID=UPI0028BE7C06|nr:hypothetical protein [Rhodoferax sp. TBRC 17198]MDT7523132.1 hypothetical protein [Rhodoferax sp. TBRC 17198]
MAEQLRATAKQNFSDKYVKALTHWTKKLIGEVVKVDETDLSKLADTLDLYRTPGKLEEALESSDSDVRDPAITCLQNRLTIASEQLKKTAAVWENPITRMGFDSASFVTQLTEFFSLEKLAAEHELTYQKLVLPLEITDRLDFYRAALEWPNETARAKNITAIKRELDNLKTGGLAANPFWSAKFLNSNPTWVENESGRMRTRYDWLKLGDPYKSLVKKVNALDSMRLSSLHRAVKKGDSAGSNWINNQFALYGLAKPEVTELKTAAKRGKFALLKALVEMRQKALEDKVKKEFMTSRAKELSPITG